MSDFRLPRLPRNVPITNGNIPTVQLQRWWQSVVDEVESQLADIIAAQTAIAAVETMAVPPHPTPDETAALTPPVPPAVEATDLSPPAQVTGQADPLIPPTFVPSHDDLFYPPFYGSN